jgi:hypothetical protein
MHDDTNPHPAPSPHEPATDHLSWHERELVAALRRLANARSQLVALEEQLEASEVQTLDPADLAEIDAVRAEMDRLQSKAKSRFGGGAARERLAELELSERLVLERLGFATYDELAAFRAQPPPAPSVDPAIVAFARRELHDAEQAWLEIQALELPPREPDEADATASEGATETDGATGADTGGGPGGGQRRAGDDPAARQPFVA